MVEIDSPTAGATVQGTVGIYLYTSQIPQPDKQRQARLSVDSYATYVAGVTQVWGTAPQHWQDSKITWDTTKIPGTQNPLPDGEHTIKAQLGETGPPPPFSIPQPSDPTPVTVNVNNLVVTVTPTHAAVPAGSGSTTITATATRCGIPLEGHSVSFTVSGGAGSCFPASDTTNEQGQAETIYSAGAYPGVVTITATDTTADPDDVGSCEVTLFSVEIRAQNGESPPPQRVRVGSAVAFTAVPSPSGLTGAFSWTKSDAGGSIELGGTTQQTVQVTGVAPGSASIEVAFTPEGASGPANDTHSLTVFRFTVECSENEPLYDGTFTVTATMQPASLTGIIRFQFSAEISAYPGRCTNFGSESDAYLVLLEAENPDLVITQGANPCAETKTAVSTAALAIHCYDYGPRGCMQALMDVGGDGTVDYIADVPGSESPTLLGIPRDLNLNDIWDGWQGDAEEDYETAADTDTTPFGNGVWGDGFSNFEEYRGFIHGAGHFRTVPTVKDVFVRDHDALGLGHFADTNLTTHILLAGEWIEPANKGEPTPAERIVDFNGDGSQKGINMFNAVVAWQEGDPPGDPTGRAYSVGTPNACKWVKIDMPQILGGANPDGVKPVVIAHECGHDVAMPHHAQTNPPKCYMETPYDPNNLGTYYHDACLAQMQVSG